MVTSAVMTWGISVGAVGGIAWVARRVWRRVRLSRAKHRSLAGHVRWAKRLSRLLVTVDYEAPQVFACDGAPPAVVEHRHQAFDALMALLRDQSLQSTELAAVARPRVSDMQFTSRYRVPPVFSRYVRERLPATPFVAESRGSTLTTLDGQVLYDLAGSYGVTLFGTPFYADCIRAGVEAVDALGPVLGAPHALVAGNVRRLCDLSGMDEVSFHMSGTEAVMQAVRLARYHTGRTHIVQFCGAYHGWWDDVQPGVGNPSPPGNVYVLSEMSAATLRVLATREDIACVLVNPLQALHPNRGAPSDGTLLANERTAGYDRTAYTDWLRQLREVCTARGIVLIFDEVFLGFRLARGGAQEYFGVAADVVTYGKTLGGGLPVGVVCGRRRWMRRFRDDRPSDICFARGTFNAHPYVMATMHEFLRRLDDDQPGRPALRWHYGNVEAVWTTRIAALNDALTARGLPVRLVHMLSVATVLYSVPSRFNWMLQFYLRRHGLLLSWVGTGRFIFSHATTDEEWAEIMRRMVTACEDMRAGGWWWVPAGATTRTVRRAATGELVRATWQSWIRRARGKRPDWRARP